MRVPKTAVQADYNKFDRAVPENRKAPDPGIPDGAISRLVAECRQAESELEDLIEVQEFAAQSYFQVTSGPARHDRPDRTAELDAKFEALGLSDFREREARNLDPLKPGMAFEIDLINEIESRKQALATRIEKFQAKILRAKPKTQADATAKLKFLVGVLLVETDKDHNSFERMIDGCIDALARRN